MPKSKLRKNHKKNIKSRYFKRIKERDEMLADFKRDQLKNIENESEEE